MADSVIDLVVNELYRIVREEVDLHRGVKQEIEKMREELKMMKAFIRYRDVQKEKDPLLESWVEQVRDVAFEIEDIVDEYLLRIAYGEGDDAGDAHNTCLGRICSNFRKWKGKHQIGWELRSIKDKVKEIAERPKKYGYDPSSVNLPEQGPSSGSGSGSGNMEIEQFRRNSAALEDESQLVGIKEAKQELVKLLNDGDKNLKVVAIVGMGGLGKTALAKHIYREMSHFQRRAFVTVSQTLNEEEFVSDMVQHLFPTEMLYFQHFQLNRLKEELKERLKGESYLVVVDDVWKTKHWDQIKLLFPRNRKGSRVIVTTRNSRVAKHSSSEYKGQVYQLQPLSKSASWKLFCKNAFPITRTCPSNLVDMCKDIVFNKCMGVPIAILAISGLLRNKDKRDVDVWLREVRHSLEIELKENEELEMTKKILSLSFDDLPYHLKPCYMYLCIFPEDYYISWTKVIRLWISEGFVAKRDSRTLEEDADRNLWDLVDRNLIQIRALSNDGSGRVKFFRIHDFLRETVVSKSKQERFVDVISKAEAMNTRARRLCIHGHHYALKRLPHLPIRSLLMFFVGEGASKLPDDGFKFRLLGVLDLEGAPMNSFPEQICTLLLLRHLSLRRTKISNIPNSIGDLARLETLDLKYTFVSELPHQISMLQKLRHLLVARCDVMTSDIFDRSVDKRVINAEGFTLLSYESCGVKVMTNIGGLNWLQNLCFLQAPDNSEWMKGLGRLTQLRKLGLVNLKEQHWREVCSCISNMTNLLCLMLQTNESFKLGYLNSPPPSLQRLHLNGHMKVLPSWVSPSCLPNLQVLKLYNTRLKEDPGASLGGFPNLFGLVLYKAFQSWVTMRVVLPSYFPSLRMLRRMEDRRTVQHNNILIDEAQWKGATSHDIRGCAIGLDKLISLASPHSVD